MTICERGPWLHLPSSRLAEAASSSLARAAALILPGVSKGKFPLVLLLLPEFWENRVHESLLYSQKMPLFPSIIIPN